MKMLHALGVQKKREEEADVNDSERLRKGAFEIDKSFSISKSDGRYIVKKLEPSGQQIELSR